MKKDIDRGCVHADMFLLTQKPDKDDIIKYKWVSVKQAGVRVTPRCGVSAVLIQSANQAFVFGGVYDNDDDADEVGLRGIFYNDLLALDLEKLHWRTVTLAEKKVAVDDSKGRGRRRRKEETDKELGQSNNSDEEEASEESSNLEQPTVSVDDDGIFTVCCFSFFFYKQQLISN